MCKIQSTINALSLCGCKIAEKESANAACMLLTTAGARAASRSLRGSVDSFYEKTVPSYSDSSFYSHFHMSRRTMQVHVLSFECSTVQLY